MTVCKTGQRLPRDREIALPFFSTDTHDEALALQVRFCRLSYPPNERYMLTNFARTIEDIDRVAAEFAEAYSVLKKRKRTTRRKVQQHA